MEIRQYLAKHKLIGEKNSYTDYSTADKSKIKSTDMSGMIINKTDFTENFELYLNLLTELWQNTRLIMAISTSEIQNKGLDKILQNTISAQAVPAAPGLYYFFKENDLRERFLLNLQYTGSGNRKEDLLVYLALSKLKNENILSTMPQDIKNEVKSHLGNNIRALAESRKLLTAISNRSVLLDLCRQSEIGIQDDEAMWLHTSLIKDLNPALRVYVGCSAFFFGDPETADIIKIHKKSSKVTYYLYDDFENKLLPEMHDRIKIDLSRQKVDHFNHRSSKNPEVVYFKERFVTPRNNRYEEWNQFSRYLQTKGYNPERIHVEQNKNLKELLTNFCA